MKSCRFLTEKPLFLGIALVGLIGGVTLISSFLRAADTSILCSLSKPTADKGSETPIQLKAILHYATSHDVPQQSLGEISVTYDVLRSLSPCNFLVFGLGLDSLMWASLNPGGTTLFLEEDPKWFETVTQKAPYLKAHAVKYRTRLAEAANLLRSYKSEPECSPAKSYIKGNDRCKLALTGLPSEVYDKEWDLIMIDAPKGYLATAPGKIAAIYSAVVMVRNRKPSGVTHVFLHDVDRRVEKVFAEEFLCRKNLVKGMRRLWHFELPSAANVSRASAGSRFC